MEQKQQGNESEPTTSLDETRNEEPWTRKGEELIREWNADIKRRESLHDESGYYYKKMRKRWGLPAIILPAVMAPISTVFSDKEWIKYVNMTSFVIVAIMGGIDSFFSFSTRKERHFNHSARYGELSTAIEGELFKNKRFRIQSDVFCTEVRMRYDMLNTTAPVIPDYLQERERRRLAASGAESV
ncbi:MAG: hypothetical protein CML47_07115 [Rhodobacteraceae bacterium]|nr:MAG: hypothetical protein CML47_07115 [Paracoccaceae bacterium]|tara:strand:- start:3892 stop:4446 length:555 start_codon:yes stop_codon:yes gene_type:complete